MSGAVSYRAIMRGQTPDGVWHEPGAQFTTDAPEGAWMQPLDAKGNPIAKEKPQAVVNAGANEAALEAVRREVTEKAQVVFDQQRTDFEQKLQAETARADDAEKQLSEAKAGFEKQLSESDTALDKATQHIVDVEKERDALKAEVEKLKAAPTAKAK